MRLLVGADPEIFMKDRKGRLACAHGVVNGTKEAPHPVMDGAVQVDGTALEFNIHPARNEERFVHNIESVMGQLEEMIGDNQLHLASTARFGFDKLASFPPEAREMGCDPDLNAWSGLENPRPNDNLSFRSAGGHVHIGWTEGMDIDDPAHMDACRAVVKELDFRLGLPSLMKDPDTLRRKLYGGYGAFRVKPYGCEYRVLSNFWIKDEEHIRWVYKVVQGAIRDLEAGEHLFSRQYSEAHLRAWFNKPKRFQHDIRHIARSTRARMGGTQ